jgi:uncharacterized protein (TIGR02271 family)
MTKTVVGLYDDFNDARKTVQDLVDSGFRRDDISLVASNATGEFDQYDRDGKHRTEHDRGDVSTEEGAGIGAGIGAAIGGLGGLLMGLGVLAIPGVGPALAAGPIASLLVGAGIGGVTGGVAGALANMGVPEEEAGYYAEGVRRGGTLVTVATADDRADDVAAIMSRHNPVDIDERAGRWREEGWTGYDRNAKPYTAEQVRTEREKYHTADTGHTARPKQTTRTERDEAKLPVVEEELQVGKRQVQRGGARVHTHVTERPVEENVRLREEHVDVERRPVDRPVSEADRGAFRDETFEVTETAEEAVVGKRARVIEEVVVSKDVGERTEKVSDTVRRTDVDVERVGKEQAVGQTGFETHDSDFRTHYNSNLADSGYTYAELAPVYRYGYSLGSDPGYNNRDWSKVEPEARKMWEERNPGTWDQFKGEVRYAWEQARSHR